MFYVSHQLQPLFTLKMSTMKKVAFIMFCCFFAIGTAVASEPDYVIVDNQVYLVKTLHTNTFLGFTGKNDEGRLRFKASEVQAYRKAGEVYWRMPVVENGEETGRYAFMKLLTSRSGFAVYRHTKYIDNWTPVYALHIFKGSDYTLTVDERNRDQLLKFFSFAI